MQESSKFAVGIDIGTTTVRCVVGHIDHTTGVPTIVGVGSANNSGMRKGTVVNLAGPAQAIDDAVGEAERMSGYQIDSATISINGSHILSTHADGMIAVSSSNHEVNGADLVRIEEVATLGKIPANREVLEVVPHQYKLDGQENIKNPIGMTGTRLELDAHVVSVLVPHIVNLRKAVEAAKINAKTTIVSGVAAARAVLSEQQLENGVILIDIGGATTNIAIYEEGDLQYTAVLPVGGVNITNDLAIGLKIDPELAEQIKLLHASAISRREDAGFTIDYAGEKLNFNTSDVDEIVDARLEEIFESIAMHIKRAGRVGKLPSGAVITGGTAMLKGLADYAKEALGMAARIGVATGYSGVADGIDKPQFATAIGLMLIDSSFEMDAPNLRGPKNKSSSKLFSNLLSRFRV